MSRFWSPVVHDLTPYVPGEQPKLANLVKLNTNENPYPPSPRVLEAIRDELGESADSLKLYPDPTGSQLKAAVGRHFGVPPEWVFVGNSSDEVLAHTFQALLKHDKPLLFPDISYSFYPVYCGLYGIDYETVALDEDFAICVDDYLARGAAKVGAVIFPNPNAPTGRLLPLADIARLAAALPDSPIVIDEAYVDFGGLDVIPTAVGLVKQHPNILVTQTLSKSRSLAGLRVGYAIGQPELIEALTRVKDSFNSYPLDRLAIVGASAAMDDADYFDQTRRHVIASRDALSNGLAALGFSVLPSAANFVFARHPARDAAALAAALRERSIIVRHFKAARIDQFLRITVGTDVQCRLLLDALKEILA
ncbi:MULTISPECIES: histidinol-phosphate transaminase [Zoogloea]|jgi:histidinol-phosphate aminotransferase|uniref:Histidinol-phosphate aminotransferase n=1 Tax=Zoogloea oleivorans TaxID=1552750 RepID=A0A6C2CMQ5_9RHOO|nr:MULTISPECIES: histidinol-phosphate transaminase [Zoogloea]MDD2667299.1 histidinol-phosphate transaminase [Zoogloea sp.]TYC54689.1 histidinol-phosphate transaminase [Zoogloea oleivorans]